MKVMYIIHTWKLDGSSISLLNLIEGIRLSNIDVVVVHPKPNKNDAPLINKLTSMGCKCIATKMTLSINHLEKNGWGYIKFIIKHLLIAYRKIVPFKELSLIVNKEKPDIIHTNTGVVHEGFWVSKKYNIPHVWHLREYQTKDFSHFIFPSKYIFSKMLKKSYSICISKDIQKYFELDNTKESLVIYNPALSNSLSEEQYDKQNYFLVANRLSPEKGIKDILEAFATFLKEKNYYKLLLLGMGAEVYIKDLKKICNKLNIRPFVEFLGYREDVYDFMRKAKALIVGSFYEGFGRMTAEANMLGIPVIGRNTGGTKEILELTKGGFLFDTVEEMAKYMEEISSKTDYEICEFMAKPRQIAIDSFSTEQHVKKVLNLYNSIKKKTNRE